MATRSTIMVAIPQEKRGKTYKFIKDTNAEESLPYDTPEVTIPEDANFVEVYHHWDGYSEGLGADIYNGFLGKDFDYVMEHLIAGGDMSSTGIPYHAWRNDDWDGCKPTFGSTLFKKSEEYQYFRDENGKWFVRGHRYEDWTEIGKWVLGTEA